MPRKRAFCERLLGTGEKEVLQVQGGRAPNCSLHTNWKADADGGHTQRNRLRIVSMIKILQINVDGGQVAQGQGIGN